jgi:hypothetical protein
VVLTLNFASPELLPLMDNARDEDSNIAALLKESTIAPDKRSLGFFDRLRQPDNLTNRA